jgi:hypothetical protein
MKPSAPALRILFGFLPAAAAALGLTVAPPPQARGHKANQRHEPSTQ